MGNLFENYFDSIYSTNSTKWFEFSKPFDIKVDTAEENYPQFVWHYRNGVIIQKDIADYESEQGLEPTPELMDYLEQYKQQ